MILQSNGNQFKYKIWIYRKIWSLTDWFTLPQHHYWELSGTEHIYTDSGGRDAQVNHYWQSPPLTHEVCVNVEVSIQLGYRLWEKNSTYLLYQVRSSI